MRFFLGKRKAEERNGNAPVTKEAKPFEDDHHIYVVNVMEEGKMIRRLFRHDPDPQRQVPQEHSMFLNEYMKRPAHQRRVGLVEKLPLRDAIARFESQDEEANKGQPRMSDPRLLFPEHYAAHA